MLSVNVLRLHLTDTTRNHILGKSEPPRTQTYEYTEHTHTRKPIPHLRWGGCCIDQVRDTGNAVALCFHSSTDEANKTRRFQLHILQRVGRFMHILPNDLLVYIYWVNQSESYVVFCSIFEYLCSTYVFRKYIYTYFRHNIQTLINR